MTKGNEIIDNYGKQISSSVNVIKELEEKLRVQVSCNDRLTVELTEKIERARKINREATSKLANATDINHRAEVVMKNAESKERQALQMREETKKEYEKAGLESTKLQEQQKDLRSAQKKLAEKANWIEIEGRSVKDDRMIAEKLFRDLDIREKLLKRKK